MELLTYAVRRKLLSDDPLLSYVVGNKPVPVSAVAASFHDFIAPLTDEKSECLISDYPKMLNENVPVVVRANTEGGYDISGNIPDTLLEAITLVHGAGQEEIVRALADYNLQTVHGQSCEIIATNIQDEARRTLMAMESIPSIIPINTANDGPPLPEPDTLAEGAGDMGAPTQGALGEMLPAEPGPAFLEPELPETVPVAETAPAWGTNAPAPDMAFAEGPGPVEEPYQTQGYPDSGLAGADEKPADTFAQSIRNIYDKFCADLRNFGLDKRLGIALA